MQKKRIVQTFSFILVLVLGITLVSAGFWSDLFAKKILKSPAEGLIAEYHFDGDAIDSIGGNNGVATNTQIVSGYDNSGLFFNGVNSKVNATDLDLTGDVTISLWFNPAETYYANGKQAYLISKYREYAVDLYTDGKLRFTFYDSAARTFTTNQNFWFKNTWYNIIVRREASKISFFVNGQLDKNSTFSYGTIYTSNHKLMIGANEAGKLGFNGTIDEVKLWNRALTNSEISEEFSSVCNQRSCSDLGATCGKFTNCGNVIDCGSCSNELVHYNYEDSFDDVKGNYDGNVNSAPYFVTGKKLKGASFDGTDDFVVLKDSENLHLGNAYSFCSWIKWNVFTAERAIISKYGSYKMDADSTGKIRFTLIGVKDYTFNYIPPLDEFVHICITYDNNYVTLYKDGNLIQQQAKGTYVVKNSSSQVVLGRYTGYFRGALDETKIWNRVLSSTEVFNEFSSSTCTPNCNGKTCGDNGCGGSCGACSGTSQCIDGTCRCIPVDSCSSLGKQCGTWQDSSCGTLLSCGNCPTGQICNSLGSCACDAIGNCNGKQCGSDGCGGSCGSCSSGYECNTASGQCQAECSKATCSGLGKQCGTFLDGCGGSLNCGSCLSTETCNYELGRCVSILTCNDSDNDGFNNTASCGGISNYDCNDNNKTINTFAVETCDGVDNDCDGTVDEDCVMTCTDSDLGIDYAVSGQVEQCLNNVCNNISDSCVGEAYVKEGYCEGNKALSKESVCLYGCYNGKCNANPALTTCSDGTAFNSCSLVKPLYCNADGAFSNNCGLCGCPQGLECKDAECITPQACRGCTFNGKCVNVGFRANLSEVGSSYCSYSNSFEIQKEKNEECYNNYECKSNECSDRKCVDLIGEIRAQTSLIKKLLCWIIHPVEETNRCVCISGDETQSSNEFNECISE